MTKGIFSWILGILAALILLQTLYFKFSGAEESIYIFTRVGMEPWGRFGSGIAELIAGILLLLPKTRAYGALIGLGVISGALFFHLTSLGIEVLGDGGMLFLCALIVFVSCLVLLVFHFKQLPIKRLFR
ncbi:MAG: DoxX family protein [Bacteroidota bacterium]|nr:DoxX family protein [Bacteroidota bacterium]MDX5431364.1 DoxX family protein [Bacteroidota bacterium]MDX5470094.1 DoxX family protein [Bacteroidota bacterium]